MKAGIIDMGSNSVRLLLGTLVDGTWHNENKQLWTTQLGDRTADGLLKEERIAATMNAIQAIYDIGTDYGVNEWYAYATSAVRESPNGAALMKRIHESYPIQTMIWSGEEEARWGFSGAVGHRLADGRHYGIIDIGGGSTEVAVGDTTGPYWAHSYPMGAVRYQELWSLGPQAIWEETRFMWHPLQVKGPFGEFIAIGGTATTLAAIDQQLETYDPKRIQDYKLTREVVENWLLQLRYMTAEERLALPGMDPRRVNTIVSGGDILTSCMDMYDILHVYVSERDGMEGFQEGYVTPQ